VWWVIGNSQSKTGALIEDEAWALTVTYEGYRKIGTSEWNFERLQWMRDRKELLTFALQNIILSLTTLFSRGKPMYMTGEDWFATIGAHHHRHPQE